MSEKASGYSEADAQREKKETVKFELVWTKKGFEYSLREKDGYIFLRCWKKTEERHNDRN